MWLLDSLNQFFSAHYLPVRFFHFPEQNKKPGFAEAHRIKDSGAPREALVCNSGDAI